MPSFSPGHLVAGCDSVVGAPSSVSSSRACSSDLKSGWFSKGSSIEYRSRGIVLSSPALRCFRSRCSWIAFESDELLVGGVGRPP